MARASFKVSYSIISQPSILKNVSLFLNLKTVTALGFPAIAVVTTTSQAATNEGDDEDTNTQTPTNDVKSDVDVSIVP